MKFFPKAQYLILTHLQETDAEVSLRELEDQLNVPSTQVYGDCLTLQDMGYICINEKQKQEIIWKGYDEEHDKLHELPERTIVNSLKKLGGQASVPEIEKETSLNSKVIGKTLKILQIKGWAELERGILKINNNIDDAFEDKTEDEKLLEVLINKGSTYDDELSPIDLPKALFLLKTRNKWYSVKQRKIRSAMLTEKGSLAIENGIKMKDTVNDLSPELLLNDAWKEVEFKQYDVNDISDPVPIGKIHPMTRVINTARKIFVEMGFEEVRYTNVESSFWDFDALFQPQDHPAREMQDTFYLKNPSICDVPEQQLIEKIKRVHEDGADTGSKGWGYKWDLEKSKKAILRTHTTAATIRALHERPCPPRKVFLVGKVFRRETIDYKHLPFFHQVDGIIIDKDANLKNLLGTLDIFYRKMGFSKFYFRPAFFPYTEPSVEIYVYNPKKNDWMEMGGAGIFRKEVTKPLGCDVPVLAWGLGLERIAMFKYDIDFIKDLYISDIEWLKEIKICP